jgi:hypothetical protein
MSGKFESLSEYKIVLLMVSFATAEERGLEKSVGKVEIKTRPSN